MDRLHDTRNAREAELLRELGSLQCRLERGQRVRFVLVLVTIVATVLAGMHGPWVRPLVFAACAVSTLLIFVSDLRARAEYRRLRRELPTELRRDGD
jgi:hypothetical protein